MSVHLSPEKSHLTPIEPTNSARVHYTQASTNSADSSVSSSTGTPDKSCFMSVIETIQSWLSAFWQWITGCCKGEETQAQVTTAQSTQTNAATPSSQQSQAIEPFSPEKCEQKMARMVQTTIAAVVASYKEKNQARFDPHKEYCICLDFELEVYYPNQQSMTRGGSQLIHIKNGQIIGNASRENIIKLEGNECGANQVKCKARVFLGEYFPDGGYRFYMAKEACDSQPGSFTGTSSCERSAKFDRQRAIEYLNLCTGANLFLDRIQTAASAELQS